MTTRRAPPPRLPTRRPLLLGMVHLPPLPGSPRWSPPLRGRGRPPAWIARAVQDAETLAASGFDGVLVENFGDAPFHKGRVPAETTAALAVAAAALRTALPP
ncbi:MAG: BtpA/SgcQ family protein, partial [Planctomycetota bacterium]|nr:BtpA/SgcQ family protein [Planctomycetota bacterium]